MIAWLLAASWAAGVTAPPLERSTTVTVTVTGAPAGSAVDLVGGTPGTGPCPPVLGGACLPVRSPRWLGRQVADAAGVATWSVRVPAAAPLVDVGLVAVVQASASVSPVTVVPVLGTLPAGQTLDVATPATWRQLQHLVRIDGDVTVHDLPLTTVALPYLTRVDGHLAFVDTAAQAIALPALRTGPRTRCETGALDLVRNLALHTVDAPALEATSLCSWGNGPVTYTLPALRTAGHVVLSSVGRLPSAPTDAVALVAPALETIDALDVYYARLTALDLPGLATANGPIQLWHDDLLTDLALPALGSAPLLVTVDDPVLSSCVVDAVVAGGAVGAVDCRQVDVDAACPVAGCTP
ncbi:MAG: hypothetical protein H6733_09875 [Alphaproteobacteria bacterium]|nr:hypothetical protein [Alphaproteobacteria bacterium]